MENFEYSIQLSDKDWADFSEAAEECGLLQAALASGDEPLSSDIDQGDSSGSSPPGPPLPRLLRVRAGSPPSEGLLKALGRRSLPGPLATAQGGCSGSEEEEEGTDALLVSRFRCEHVLAPGAGQQTQCTSTRLEEQLPSGVLHQLTPALVPQPSLPSSTMQKSLQGAAAQASEVGVHSGKDPPNQEQPSSLGSTDGKRSPREPNLGASPRSPGKKKKRSAGAKGGGSPKAQSTKRQAPPSPSLAPPPSSGSQPDRGPSTRAHSNLAPANSEGHGPGAESLAKAAGLGTRASHGPDPQDPSPSLDLGPKPSSPALGPEAPQEQSFLNMSSPVPKTETRVNVSTPTWIPEAEENLSTPVSLAENFTGAAFMIEPGGNLSTPVSLAEKGENLTGTASLVDPSGKNLSTPVSKLHKNVFTSDTKTNSDIGFSTSTPKSEPERYRSTLVLMANEGVGPATLVPKAQPNVNMSIPALQVQPDVKLSISDLKAEPERNISTAPGARADVGVSTPAQIAKSWDFPVSPQGLHGAPEEGNGTPLSPEPLGEPSLVTDYATQSPAVVIPAQAPRRKKVRFSGISSSPPEISASALASSPSALIDSSAVETPRTLGGGRGGPRTWDAVAVGLRPQPRILKHSSFPSAKAREAKAPREEDFALTLPEAYDYFFCDTIVEEEEEEEEEEEDIPSTLEWPEVCEYFFRDSQIPEQRPPPGPLLQVPAHDDPVPISIPEAYEHLFGEEEPSGGLLPWVPVTLSNQQTLGPEPAALQVWPGISAPEDQNPPKAEELGLTVNLEGEQRAPLIPITFNQNDMCLGFVAFATWAVRTSDLHAPDAWKTVLLANIGAISAIRYFRRQAREGHPSP